ncbi:hypothetical protein A3L08_05935 [Thermococcus pacificus]|uniref:Bacterial Pleckstrin homology domain-containing protein n=2 Tax=Thermococcus pacificus TaxID=71998 RepID=A0A218P7Y3_9EURY|nr:hypothetical protein A3L08_05935 [Thermococcus pacificus]
MGGWFPLVVVLTPIVVIALVVAVKIKGYMDAYVPWSIVVAKNGTVRLIIKTKAGEREILVRDFDVKESSEVLEVRINGLGFGRYQLGEYKGPFGYVKSYAVSRKGLLVTDVRGKRYYLAFEKVDDVLKALRGGPGKTEIKVRG